MTKKEKNAVGLRMCILLTWCIFNSIFIFFNFVSETILDEEEVATYNIKINNFKK